MNSNELDDLSLEYVAGGGDLISGKALTCGAACIACAACQSQGLPPQAPAPRNTGTTNARKRSSSRGTRAAGKETK